MLAILEQTFLEEAREFDKRFFGESLATLAIEDWTRRNPWANDEQSPEISFKLTASRFSDRLAIGCKQSPLGESYFGNLLWEGSREIAEKFVIYANSPCRRTELSCSDEAHGNGCSVAAKAIDHRGRFWFRIQRESVFQRHALCNSVC